jgi:hypothetical protein
MLLARMSGERGQLYQMGQEWMMFLSMDVLSENDVLK